MEASGKTSCIFWTEAMLTPCGLRRDTSTSCVALKLFNYFLMVNALFRTGVASYMDLVGIINAFSVYKFADAAFWLFVWLWHLTMIMKRKEHAIFLRQASSLLPLDEEEIIRSTSRRFALLCAIYYVLHLLWAVPFLDPNRTWVMKRIFVNLPIRPAPLIALGNVVLLYEIYVTALWMAMTMMLYMVAHSIKHLIRLQSLRVLFQSHGPRKGVRIMHKVEWMDQQFTSAFSIFPFLILAANFFQAAGYLLNQLDKKAGRKNQIDRIQLIGLSMTFLSVPVVLVSIVSKRHAELSQLKSKPIDHLARQENKTHADVSLIEMVMRSMGKETAWKMIPIDWPLVTAYLGYLLSFSVLFHQLLPHIVEADV